MRNCYCNLLNIQKRRFIFVTNFSFAIDEKLEILISSFYINSYENTTGILVENKYNRVPNIFVIDIIQL